MSGQILEVNTALLGDPAPVNRDPEGARWLHRMAPNNPNRLDGLIAPAACNAVAAALQAVPSRQRRGFKSQGARAASV